MLSLCDLMSKAYRSSLDYLKIVNDFKVCGLCCQHQTSCNPKVINAKDINNWEGYAMREDAKMKYLDRYKRFLGEWRCFTIGW